MAEKIFTRQNGDENAQSARELASKKSCVRFSCVRHRSDNPNRARECDRLESLEYFTQPYVTANFWNAMDLTPSTSDSPPADINLTVHNYVQNSPLLSRASQDKLLSQGWRLAQNALSTSARWRNAKMVPTLTCLFEPKISLFFPLLDV